MGLNQVQSQLLSCLEILSKQVFFQEFCIMLVLKFFAKKIFSIVVCLFSFANVSLGWPDHYKNKFSISRRDVWYPQVHCTKSSMYFDMWEVFFVYQIFSLSFEKYVIILWYYKPTQKSKRNSQMQGNYNTSHLR